MRRRLLFLAFIVFVAGLLAACSTATQGSPSGTPARGATTVSTPGAGSTAPAGTPVAGAKMDTPAVIEALRKAGVTVAAKEGISQPFFSVPGTTVEVNGQSVQVFVYPDAGAAAAEAGRVMPDGGSTTTTSILWVDDPHFFRTGNVIALYVGKDETVLRALRTVFGPQFAGR